MILWNGTMWEKERIGRLQITMKNPSGKAGKAVP